MAIIKWPYCYQCNGKGFILTDTRLIICPCGCNKSKLEKELNIQIK